VTFRIDGYEISAADCTRDVMAITKCAFYSGGGPAALAGVFGQRLGVD
jgi:hypothetical protein